MGVYYKLVNRETKERIEPSQIGNGGIKFNALVLGLSARLLMYLHLQGQSAWTVLSDSSDSSDEYFESDKKGGPGYLTDVTEKYLAEYKHHFGRMPGGDG